MDKQIIRLKIDVKKIDKSKLYHGKKGVYLDATMFLSQDPDQYGNHAMITQDVSKEDREAGVKGAILGNATIYVPQGGKQSPAPVSTTQADVDARWDAEDDGSIPF